MVRTRRQSKQLRWGVAGCPQYFPAVIDTGFRDIEVLCRCLVVVADPDVDGRRGQKSTAENREERQYQQCEDQSDSLFALQRGMPSWREIRGGTHFMQEGYHHR